MPELHTIEVTVNGTAQRCQVAPRQHLVDFLRGPLGLKGSHLGCEHGVCGACTVGGDGQIVRGCLTLAVQADGRAVRTIEGVSADGDVRDLQEAFVRRNALQCGFCTPGMVMAARELLRVAREGAAFPKRPKFILGPEGRGWLARAEAEFRRASGDNDPAEWETAITEFGPVYVYEVARTRWRLAEALAEAGRKDEASKQWHLAACVADDLHARPLRRALEDLARRARIGTAEQRGDGTVLAALTSREREVLRLIAAGRSNREIASVLFIAPKTASVHVSNILGKLGAASRTEAAAIAHREGLSAQNS